MNPHSNIEKAEEDIITEITSLRYLPVDGL